MIEPAQLRRWKEGFRDDYDDTVFLVLSEQGEIRATGGGGLKPIVPVRLWRILVDGEVCSGWTDDLLENLSEALDETG